jgi:hypothetical protein
MVNSRHSPVLLVSLLQLSISGVSFAQDAPASCQTVEAVVHTKSDFDELPKFEIEVVVFAYEAFDPTEEIFGREPAALTADGLPATADLRADEPREIPLAAGGLPNQADRLNDFDVSSKALFRLEMLDPEDLMLTEACDKLTRLDAYTVLVHGGWIQEGLPEGDAHEIDMSVFGEPSISGTLQLYVSRFAHLTAAIDYHAPTESPRPLEAASPGVYSESISSPPRFELRQTRRMRSGELHYFDHPAFGLLVALRRHEEMQKNAASSSESSEPTSKPAA